MLLKSCAMPPVSWPIASIFCDWRQAPLEQVGLGHVLGDVDGAGDPLRRIAHRRARIGNLAHPAVLVQPPRLHSLHALARHDAPVQATELALRILGERCKRPAGHGIRRAAENALSRAVPGRDAASRIEAEDRQRRGVEQRLEPGIEAGDSVRRLPSLVLEQARELGVKCPVSISRTISTKVAAARP